MPDLKICSSILSLTSVYWILTITKDSIVVLYLLEMENCKHIYNRRQWADAETNKIHLQMKCAGLAPESVCKSAW